MKNAGHAWRFFLTKPVKTTALLLWILLTPTATRLTNLTVQNFVRFAPDVRRISSLKDFSTCQVSCALKPSSAL
jgi:hypothetical protein